MTITVVTARYLNTHYKSSAIFPSDVNRAIEHRADDKRLINVHSDL